MMDFPAVYPILDWDACAARGLDPGQVLETWQSLGVTLCQLRAKPLAESAYEDWAMLLRNRARAMRFVANDHASLAVRRTDLFWGLHIGQQDLELLRRTDPDLLAFLLAGESGLRVGLSTHGAPQLERACREMAGLAYVALGPLFATGSKPGGIDPVLDAAQLSAALVTWTAFCRASGSEPPPLVLIGGLGQATFEATVPPGFSAAFGFLPVPAVIAAALDPSELASMLAYADRLRLDRQYRRHNLA